MKEIFADAFYYIALLNPRDHFHHRALKLTGELSSRLVTTSAVLFEIADALSSPQIRAHTHHLLKGIAADSNTTVLSAEGPLFARSLELYGARPDKNWSLTDCLSFTVMTERQVTDALTGDHHFVQAGFRALMLD